VLARGLGLLQLITNFLHFHDAAGNNLVVVVGADERENEWIGEGTISTLGLRSVVTYTKYQQHCRSIMTAASLYWLEV
jgi:hypothetical protein